MRLNEHTSQARSLSFLLLLTVELSEPKPNVSVLAPVCSSNEMFCPCGRFCFLKCWMSIKLLVV